MRAIANISAEYIHTAAIVETGPLIPLVKMLSSTDMLNRRFAVMGIGNLATNVENQEKTVYEGWLEPLMILASAINNDIEAQRY